ncbi:hypothetical protein BD770DRAFT_427198 [Pilaira anomala]|nr:hypothetical protein BD770DRAFT_427198 [Pilaira anomala]
MSMLWATANGGTALALTWFFEPKAQMTESPPIIAEFQHTINEEFMRRVTNYSLETAKRYHRCPIVLIVCVIPSAKCNTLSPLDAFVALRLFLTRQDNSIITSHCGDDQTVKQLYDFATEYYQSIVENQLHLIEVLKQVFATQNREYESLLELVNKQTPFEALSQAIGQAQSRGTIGLIFFVPKKYGFCGEV